MRWLLEWLLAGAGPGGPEVRSLSRIRGAMARVRRRADYHRASAGEARDEFDRAVRRVKFLELSEEAEVPELVEAHQRLLQARHALDHHERRLEASEALHELMRGDQLRLQDGREPKHGESYAEELDG